MKLIAHLFKKSKTVKPTYATYAEALAMCNNTGYEDKVLCDLVAEKTVHYKNQLRKRPFTVNPVHCYLTLTIQHIMLQQELRQVAISDFGGGCGAHYFETIRFIDENRLLWTVIETPQMVNSAVGHQLNENNLHFTHNPREVSGQLIYLSSSIQYVPDPYAMLDVLIERNFTYMLFNRMMLHANAEDDIITVQQSRLSDNGPGTLTRPIEDRMIQYPHTTLSLQKFMRKMESAYELIFKFDEPSGNIDPNNTAITGGGFLFKRK